MQDDGVPDVRCSQAALLAGDDPTGSATDFSAFLLLTERGPWGPRVADDVARAHLGADAAELAVAGTGGLRAFAIRPVTERRIARDDEPDPVWAGQVGPDGRLFRLDRPPDAAALRRLAAGEPLGTAAAGPLIAVCTNGRRDRCCAIAGRPIAADLHARHPGAVTEISHLGGHRYAGTLMVLPWGYCYGFLDGPAARRVADAAMAYLVHPDHLRGRSALPPAAQAAEARWRREIGPAAPDAVRITAVGNRTDGVVEVCAQVLGERRSSVVRYTPGRRIEDTACGGKPFVTGRWVPTD